MRDVFFLLFDLLATLAKLARSGGRRSIIAENLILKQQLIIHSRSRHRAPNLNTHDRALLGFMSLFLPPRRIVRAAIIIKPSTLLSFHNALKKRKYRLLYSPRGGRKPGPKGPSKDVINATVAMKQRNPQYGCPRIAQQINLAFGLENKLRRYQRYYNEHRCHSSRDGDTPIESDDDNVVCLNCYRWQKHRRGLFQLPVAA